MEQRLRSHKRNTYIFWHFSLVIFSIVSYSNQVFRTKAARKKVIDDDDNTNRNTENFQQNSTCERRARFMIFDTSFSYFHSFPSATSSRCVSPRLRLIHFAHSLSPPSPSPRSHLPIFRLKFYNSFLCKNGAYLMQIVLNVNERH